MMMIFDERPKKKRTEKKKTTVAYRWNLPQIEVTGKTFQHQSHQSTEF
jgi:hypothetical protein